MLYWDLYLECAQLPAVPNSPPPISIPAPSNSSLFVARVSLPTSFFNSSSPTAIEKIPGDAMIHHQAAVEAIHRYVSDGS